MLATLWPVLALALLWGPSYMCIKWQLTQLPPFTLAALRIILGTTGMWLVFFFRGHRLKDTKGMWRYFIWMGLFASAIPFSFFGWGERGISSALTAMINGLVPSFTALTSYWFIGEDKLCRNKVLGLLVGFAGLLFFFIPMLGDGIEGNAEGVLWVTGACCSYAFGFVYGRRRLSHLPPSVAASGHLTCASFWSLLLSCVFDRPWHLDWSLILADSLVLGATLYIGVCGTTLAFLVYYRALSQGTATQLALVAYILPFLGTSLGVLVLGEHFRNTSLIGAVFVFLSMFLVHGIFKPLKPGLCEKQLERRKN